MKKKIIVTLLTTLFLAGCANSDKNELSNTAAVVSETSSENSTGEVKEERYFTRTVDECAKFVGCEITGSEQIGDYDFYLCSISSKNANIYFSTEHNTKTVVSIVIQTDKSQASSSTEIMSKFKDFCQSSANQSGTLSGTYYSYNYYTCGNFKDTVTVLKDRFETKDLNLSLEKCISILKSEEFDDFRAVEYEKYTAHYALDRGSIVEVVLYTENKSDKVFAARAVAKTKYATSSKEDAAKYIQRLLNACSDITSENSEIGYIEHDDYTSYWINPFVNGYTCAELPFDFSKTSDFFSDSERTENFRRLMTAGKYQELNNYINSYIESNSIKEDDSAFELLESLSPIIENVDKLNIFYDEFDDSKTIFALGITDISSNCYFVPYISTIDVEVKMGFIKDDWLFFNSVSIKTDSDIFSHSSDTVRDVLSGGVIKEYQDTRLYDTDREHIANTSSATIRFENTSTKETLDHVLTENELNSFKILHKVSAALYEIGSINNRRNWWY